MRGELEFDDGGAVCRIGLIVLSTDLATESDFSRALACHPVRFHTTRIRNINPVTPENLRTMGPLLGNSAAHILPGMPLDALAYSCTSGTAVLGFDTVHDQIAEGRPGVPVATPASGAANALRALGACRIALLTPYTAQVGEEMTKFFDDEGFETVRRTHLGIESDVDMAYLAPSAIRQAARQADHPDADALFISCTAIRAMEVLDELESELKKPCLAAIQCLLWDALRLGGYETPLHGEGMLLAMDRTMQSERAAFNSQGQGGS